MKKIPKRHKKCPQPGKICVYCGDYADTLDHVPSLAVRRLLPLNSSVAFALVPACRNCNVGILRNDYSLTVDERKEVVREYLKKKISDTMWTQEWSEEQLETLSPEFRRRIRAAITETGYLLRRYAYAVQNRKTV